MTTRLRDEAGQALVVTTIFLAAVLGGVAMSLDVGSWYREHRQAQSTADAAALAGAQALPDNPSNAMTLAQNYAADNGGGLSAGDISFASDYGTNDTVKVTVRRDAPGFFSKLFGIDAAKVHASAAARSTVPGEAKWAAPIVVNKKHPLLSGSGCPCFNVPTTLPLGKTGAPGAFALVNLDNQSTGTIGASTLADWILRGFDRNLPLGDYFSDPGAKWNNSSIQGALQKRFGTELLFPVYDTLSGTGSNAEYHIIGWVAFHVTGVTADGTGGTISGWFKSVIWTGIQSSSNSHYPDFGVHSVALVN
jgi:predicted outer membrane repeat protein